MNATTHTHTHTHTTRRAYKCQLVHTFLLRYAPALQYFIYEEAKTLHLSNPDQQSTDSSWHFASPICRMQDNSKRSNAVHPWDPSNEAM